MKDRGPDLYEGSGSRQHPIDHDVSTIANIFDLDIDELILPGDGNDGVFYCFRSWLASGIGQSIGLGHSSREEKEQKLTNSGCCSAVTGDVVLARTCSAEQNLALWFCLASALAWRQRTR